MAISSESESRVSIFFCLDWEILLNELDEATLKKLVIKLDEG